MKRGFGVGIEGEKQIPYVIEKAKEAEALGFTDCWIAEDYFYAGACSLAAACIGATKRIRVGIGVLNPFTRHPALIAMEAATLHHLASGRFTLGLGGSNALWVQKRMGIPFERVVTCLREAVQILRGMFRGESTCLQGEKFQVQNARLRVPGCEKIPIVLGVKSEQLLRLAAAEADGALLSIGVSLPYIVWARQRLEEGAKAAGRSLEGFQVAAYLLISIDEDGAAARARCKAAIAYFLGLHGDHPILRLAGVDGETVKPFREGFLRGEYPAHLVTEEMIDAFSISGTPHSCRETLKAYLRAGLTHPVVFDFPGIPLEENMRMVRTHLFDLMEE